MTKRKICKSKNPIKIREKLIKDGNISLYLDIYYNGIRRYEFLKLYLIPEINKAARLQNRKTWEIAEAIKAERYKDLINGKANIKHNYEKVLLLKWIKECQQKMEDRKPNVTLATISILKKYISWRQVFITDIDIPFCKKFIHYLTKEYISSTTGRRLNLSSANIYISCFSFFLNIAVRENIIPYNPFTKIASIDKVHATESNRQYLTIEEVKLLIQTDCPNSEVKNAFLFSCFCGLRISDIKALKWGNIIRSNGQYHIDITMQKTKERLLLPLSQMAIEWLPVYKRKSLDTPIFFLPSISWICEILQKWCIQSGITKHITFHCARHTFATLNLTGGVDLYTTSKLLGHKNISTTQIYAKIVDKKKDEAAKAIDKLFNNN